MRKSSEGEKESKKKKKKVGRVGIKEKKIKENLKKKEGERINK